MRAGSGDGQQGRFHALFAATFTTVAAVAAVAATVAEGLGRRDAHVAHALPDYLADRLEEGIAEVGRATPHQIYTLVSNRVLKGRAYATGVTWRRHRLHNLDISKALNKK